MMNEALQNMLMVMQLADTYAEKSAMRTLTEYEVLMYEQICNCITEYLKLTENLYKNINVQEEEEIKIDGDDDH